LDENFNLLLAVVNPANFAGLTATLQKELLLLYENKETSAAIFLVESAITSAHRTNKKLKQKKVLHAKSMSIEGHLQKY
jgi:hypothetical protein